MNRARVILCFVALLTLVLRTSSQSLNITTFTTLRNNHQQLGGTNDHVFPVVSLVCGTYADLDVSLRHFWYKGDTELPMTSADGRIITEEGPVFEQRVRGSALLIKRVSYKDEGEYRCECRGSTEAGLSGTDSVTISLRLIVRLEPILPVVETFNDSQFIRLGCDMAGYIRPDQDLYWTVNGMQVTMLPGTKYSVVYSHGTNVAQHGGEMTMPSRVAWLTVYNVELGDSEMSYSCAINGTEHLNGVNLTVHKASAPSGPPTNVSASVLSSTSIRIEWENVLEEERNGNITGFEVMVSALNFTRFFDVLWPVRSLVVSELQEFTEHSVAVRAFTTVGPGPYSSTVTITTLEDVPSAPPKLVKADALSPTIIRVSWQPVTDRHINGILTHYVVEFNQSSFTEIPLSQTVNTSNLSVLLQGLEEYVEYGIRVRAFTSKGAGPYSARIAATTFESSPSSPPQILSLVSFNSSSLGVQWQPPAEIHTNGVLRHYIITACSIAETPDDEGSGSASGDQLISPEEPDLCFTANVTGNETEHIVSELEEGLLYNVSVAALTVSEGPSASVNVQTGDNVITIEPGSLFSLGPDTVQSGISISCTIQQPSLTSGKALIWQWKKKNSKVLLMDGVTTSQDSQSSTLTISGLGYEDNGEYVCEVLYSEWEGVIVNSSSAVLELQYEILAPSPYVLVAQDTTFIHLECLLYGFIPSEELSWYHRASADAAEYQQVNSGIHHEEIETFQAQIGRSSPGNGIKSVLSIPLPTRDNAGTYTCALPENSAANDTVVVAFPPISVPKDDLSNVNLGIIIGVIVAVVLLIIIVTATIVGGCLYRKRKRKKTVGPAQQGSVDAHDEFVSVHSKTSLDIGTEIVVPLDSPTENENIEQNEELVKEDIAQIERAAGEDNESPDTLQAHTEPPKLDLAEDELSSTVTPLLDCTDDSPNEPVCQNASPPGNVATPALDLAEEFPNEPPRYQNLSLVQAVVSHTEPIQNETEFPETCV